MEIDTTQETKHIHVQVIVTEDVNRVLNAMCKWRGVTKPHLIGEALAFYAANHEVDGRLRHGKRI